MSVIDDVFKQLRAERRKAFMPFITAGDPDLAFTLELIHELAARGCHFCELGIPYSDPIADGPVIQASYTRALEKHVKLSQILDALASIERGLDMPVVGMCSYATIFRQGLQSFVESAQKAGMAGVIVPDLLIEEARPMAKVCQDADFALIQLVAPTTSRDRALQITETSTGFLYYVSVTGITGERTQLPAELVDNVGWLREQTDLPICIGFGISRPEHVKMLAPVADGLIVGSAIVRRMAEVTDTSRATTIKEIGQYVASLLETLSPAK
jgi:tryptophan synthase alpha chain